MIGKANSFTDIIKKINELVDEVNSLRMDSEVSALNFDNHTHDVLIGPPENFDSLRHSTYPLITMVDERESDNR